MVGLGLVCKGSGWLSELGCVLDSCLRRDVWDAYPRMGVDVWDVWYLVGWYYGVLICLSWNVTCYFSSLLVSVAASSVVFASCVVESLVDHMY